MQRLQEKFCIEFVRCGNATEAYKRAGYKVKSDKVAGVCATKLLGHARIQSHIAKLRRELDSHKIMDAAERRELLTRFARDEDTGKTDRLRAMDLLNKMDGVYINKTQISGVDGAPITFRWEGGT
ncbi:terminase small subunit [uncultured Mitsuokella sp.]|uniref:terminase small subunit n=1 Tax=uncultured Mitsuokella sp. TaxID=453120 RepID=UPI0026163555|nr:terminase small subunit [uncultured Mitsuokella sp.]